MYVRNKRTREAKRHRCRKRLPSEVSPLPTPPDELEAVVVEGSGGRVLGGVAIPLIVLLTSFELDASKKLELGSNMQQLTLTHTHTTEKGRGVLRGPDR